MNHIKNCGGKKKEKNPEWVSHYCKPSNLHGPLNFFKLQVFSSVVFLFTIWKADTDSTKVTTL